MLMWLGAKEESGIGKKYPLEWFENAPVNKYSLEFYPGTTQIALFPSQWSKNPAYHLLPEVLVLEQFVIEIQLSKKLIEGIPVVEPTCTSYSV